MARNESNHLGAGNDTGEPRKRRRRRTPEQILEEEERKLSKQTEVVKKARKVVRDKDRRKEHKAKEVWRSNDRASDGIFGSMFKRRVRDGDPEARRLYVRLRRAFPKDREHVVRQFDEEIKYAEWGPALERELFGNTDSDPEPSHSQFPQA